MTMKRARFLKNARLQYSPISDNKSYIFSLKHALSIYPIDAIYTFIPKNACSSLRYSTAIANGFIQDIGDLDWIHKNNIAFMPTQREIALAKYTFVVLRCPFTRVASCFFNQVVDGEVDFKDTNGAKLSISFNDFLKNNEQKCYGQFSEPIARFMLNEFEIEDFVGISVPYDTP